MSNAGNFILLHRKALDSQVFSDDWLWRLWCWCLLNANWRPVWERGRRIMPGQFFATRKEAAEFLNVSPSRWYEGMQKLESLHQIEMQRDTKGTVVTICKWETYQVLRSKKRSSGNNHKANDAKELTSENEQQATTKQQRSNNEATTKQQRSNNEGERYPYYNHEEGEEGACATQRTSAHDNAKIIPFDGKTTESKNQDEVTSNSQVPPRENGLTSALLAQKFCFYQTRRFNGRSADSEFDVKRDIDELVRLGVSLKAIAAEIDNRGRDKYEYWSALRLRLYGGKEGSQKKKRHPTAEEINAENERIRELYRQREAKAGKDTRAMQ